MSVGTKGILAGILDVFDKIKTELKFNEETRKEYRRKISTRTSEWVGMLRCVAESIEQKADGKRPIIIFEDLDKLDPEFEWKVFYHYAAMLSGMPFPVIYTFPIGLSYDSRFAAMEGYFVTKTLPMIKIETIDGQQFTDGIRVIREIVKKRADLELFETDVLENLIRYTGGSLRDLFVAVNAAAKRAERRDSRTVSMEDAGLALEELKTSLTRRIEKKDYPFLCNIYRGNKELIEDKETLLKMLQASVVLEYNGKRWHNVHPLVVEFLKEQGIIVDLPIGMEFLAEQGITADLPIGIDSFEKLRSMGYYYVDKTGLIQELLKDACEISLFTSPRRFGKSLNLDMLKSFFETGADPKLFEGLEILRNEGICKEFLGKYPVIFLNLKDIDGACYRDAYQAFSGMIGMEIRRLCVKHNLLDNSSFFDTDKDFLREILAGRYQDGIAVCLRKVFQLLSQACGKKVILLIDEYDVPLDKAYEKGYYEQMLNAVRNLLGMVLKSNAHLQMAVLTGCLRIAKESIFTGLNNFVVNSVSDEEYSSWFGFTHAEVLQMLRYYGLEESLDSMQEWYDGYRFGGKSVYCPWDVLNYLRKLRRNKNARPESFWANSSSNAIIQSILSGATETAKEQMEMLLSGEAIEKKLVPELTYKDLEQPDQELREAYLWSVMYAAGYLTETERFDNGVSRLVIPNREIWDIYNQKIRSWFQESIRSDTGRLKKLCEAVLQGNAPVVQSVLNDCMHESISIRDTSARKEMKENFYHGMLLGILQCEGSWAVKSNQESGTGYGDILLTSSRDKTGCVIEIKYAENGVFEKACQKAMQQIKKHDYADYFFEKDVKEIHMYGIACYKKKCCVVHENAG